MCCVLKILIFSVYVIHFILVKLPINIGIRWILKDIRISEIFNERKNVESFEIFYFLKFICFNIIFFFTFVFGTSSLQQIEDLRIYHFLELYYSNFIPPTLRSIVHSDRICLTKLGKITIWKKIGI